MARANEQSLKEVINELLAAYRLDGKLHEFRLINSWESLMGISVAKHTTKIYINKQTLFVQISSAALRNELSYAKTKLVGLLNKEAGHEVINDIVFL
jgi:predicted nucleic acid-binding Zn ribbon protein